MAQIEFSQALRALDKATLLPIYVLSGEEKWKMDQFVTALLRHLYLTNVPGARDIFYADDATPDQVLDACANGSLFQAKKICLLRQAEEWEAKDWESWKDLFLDPPPTVTIVIQIKKLDQRMKWVQALGKNKLVQVVACDVVREQELMTWIQWIAKNEKVSIAPGAIRLLTELMDPMLFEIEQTIQKAALLSKGDEISPEHISMVAIHSRSETVFKFTDALLSRQLDKSMDILLQMEKQGEEPIQLLGLIVRQYRWLLAILAHQAAGKSEQQTISDLRLYPKMAPGLIRAARERGGGRVSAGLAALLKADRALKSTSEPPFYVLQKLTHELVSRA